jgi:ABC-type nitrate/sulfonate/bicarbonate transport system substrate-binding protein
MTRERIKPAAAAAVVVLALASAACGSSSSSSGSGDTQSSGGSSATIPTFKVALPVAQAAVGSAIVIGVEGGFFKKAGVNVVVNTGLGSNTGDAVLSGQDDIGQLGMNGPLQYTSAGKPTTVIYGSTGFGLAANLFSAKDITSVAQLKAKKPCTIATLTQGTDVYGTSSYFNDSLGLGCKIVVYSAVPEVIGALASGRADATTGVNDSVTTAVAAHKINVLIDSLNASDRAKYLSSQLFTDVDYFGVTANLKSKREAVVRFIKGMGLVDKFIRTASPTAIAKILQKNSEYQTLPLATLASQLKSDRLYMDPYHGYISEADWNKGLKVLSSYGLKGFDASNPLYAYSKRVDMSYYKQALGAPPPGN